MSEPKELRYFWRDDWSQRRAWYEAHFDPAKRVRGEATPAYAMWPFRDRVPERAVALVPDARLVYVVRDPIERLASHYAQRVADGFSEPFSSYVDRLEDPENPIVCASRYATQLERWLAHFDRSQVLVLDHGRLRDERRRVLSEVLGFLGVADTSASLDVAPEHNRMEAKLVLGPWGRRIWTGVLRPVGRLVPPRLRASAFEVAHRALTRPVKARADIDDATQARLVAYFRPEVERLRELTDQPFASWSI